MDGQEQFRHLIRQKDFAITIDPKDTFHHIKVSQTLYPFFGFSFLGRTYTYTGLPFGWHNSPLIPSKKFQYPGWNWNTNIMEVTIPQQQRRLLKSKLRYWIEITKQQQIVGVKQVVSLIVLNKRILPNLYKLFELIKHNKPKELTVKTPFFKHTKEASEIGWGGLLQINNGELMDAEEWNGNWHLKPSNQREMVAVLMSLKAFSPILQQMNVDCLSLQTYNPTTEFCPRNWRSAKTLIRITRIIFLLLKNLNVSLVTEHIKGIHNSKADALNRMAHHGDYSISILILNQAITFLHLVPTIDLFASRTMKLCE
ncbi:MAG: hypothetical protein EZS28_001848, partial [Streblomastix strix]